MSIIMFQYPLTRAIDAAKAVTPHASKDDLVPVINHAQLTADAWFTTDRFSVGKYDMTAHSDDSGNVPATENVVSNIDVDPGDREYVLLPREALDWIAKLTTKTLRLVKNRAAVTVDGYYALRVVARPVDKTVSVEIVSFESGRDDVDAVGVVERSQLFETIGANFPPVDRLITDFKHHNGLVEGFELSLGAVNLKKVVDVVARFDKHAPVKIRFSGGDHVSKPGPIMVEYGRLTALLQPMLNLK